MHGFQLWVNFPAAQERIRPRDQEIPGALLPVVRRKDGRARGRIIAGEALGTKAVIDTHTPITLHHWTLATNVDLSLPIPSNQQVIRYVFSGQAESQDTQIEEGQMVTYGSGGSIELRGPGSADARLIAGEPVREPMARMGPFGMNMREELVEAHYDYQAGRLGRIT